VFGQMAMLDLYGYLLSVQQDCAMYLGDGG
jgi:hypothetical protein